MKSSTDLGTGVIFYSLHNQISIKKHGIDHNAIVTLWRAYEYVSKERTYTPCSYSGSLVLHVYKITIIIEDLFRSSFRVHCTFSLTLHLPASQKCSIFLSLSKLNALHYPFWIFLFNEIIQSYCKVLLPCYHFSIFICLLSYYCIYRDRTVIVYPCVLQDYRRQMLLSDTCSFSQ